MMLFLILGFLALAAYATMQAKRSGALVAADHLRLAIATGKQRSIEIQLRKELALAAAGEAVSPERQWLARAQLGGLLVAEWRLDEAREIYRTEAENLSPHLQALANFGRHELALLSEGANEARLAKIRSDRDGCLSQVPSRYRPMVLDAWRALEGLCLMRMGRAKDAAPLLEEGIDSLAYNPARVIYLYHLGQAYEEQGQRDLAGDAYEKAAAAFPGSRLASEAKARRLALSGGGDGLFRGMLPEAPLADRFISDSNTTRKDQDDGDDSDNSDDSDDDA